jgi:adsorption protein B
MDALDWLAGLLMLTKVLMVTVGIIFLISGMDDLFVDLVFVARSIYRKYAILSKYPRLTERQLFARPEQPLAVMIPAWDEAAVIRPMLENTLRSIQYSNFTIFVGTYLNDLATQSEVDLVCAQHPQVVKVVTPHDGPTNKADCLNCIFHQIRIHEQQTGIPYQIHVMQDCEDVIHPLCYKLFNYLIPRKDMVQLPVESLELRWKKFTGGHYLDEFAQSHYKDMIVREALGASIPAAGVGAAFSRRALDKICVARDGELFSIESLTEDYEFGFRLGELKLKQVFVRFTVDKTVTRRNFWTGAPEQVTRPDAVCVREYFPDQFKFSVRQKSRWVVGITLQGWRNLGWSGNLATRYMLFRDRKAILTNLANLLGYLMVLLILSVYALEWLWPEAYSYPALIGANSTLWKILYVNGLLFVVRAGMRAYCVHRIYGPMQALLSLPRMIWGNLINFLATVRAVNQYTQFLKTGKFIKWDKTTHHYPTADELVGYRRKIGDLLIDSAAITPDQLTQALALQSKQSKKLGEILQELGWLQPGSLSEALRRQ